MRSNLAFILDRMPLNLAESGTDVRLDWYIVTGGVADPISGSTAGGTRTPQTETVKGFVHYVQVAQSGVRQFAEFEAGDCIVDFGPAVTLEGRLGLTFLIDGQRWVAKELGEQVGKTWDALVQGQRLHRSVLLRKAT